MKFLFPPLVSDGISSPHRQRKSEGRKQRLHKTIRIAPSCLGTPALPCAYCREQVLSWTQEREERAALTDPQSPETVTDWNHRVWDDPLAQQTHPERWRAPSAFPSLFFICSKPQENTHAQQRITAECMRFMFIRNIFIPLWLYRSVIT